MERLPGVDRGCTTWCCAVEGGYAGVGQLRAVCGEFQAMHGPLSCCDRCRHWQDGWGVLQGMLHIACGCLLCGQRGVAGTVVPILNVG